MCHDVAALHRPRTRPNPVVLHQEDIQQLPVEVISTNHDRRTSRILTDNSPHRNKTIIIVVFIDFVWRGNKRPTFNLLFDSNTVTK